MHQYLLWLPLIAYPLHVLEEQILGWRNWAQNHLGLKEVTWPAFDVANLAVCFTAIGYAVIGWRLPIVALLITALMFINGLFFHILPTLIQRVFSPGVITSVLLFLPSSVWIYWGAHQDHVLTWQVAVFSLLLGAVLMAFPIVLLKVKAALDKKSAV